jgi:predicted MFS family arabinose efflux permease
MFFCSFSGLGLGLVYTPTAAMISLYFDKHRTLALGLASVGIGVGMLIYPPVIRALIHHYGWRGSLLVLGGIFLHSLPLSLLIQPMNKTSENTFQVKQEKWDFRIFKIKRYIFLCLGYMLITSCMATVFFFLPSYAVSLGVDNDTASLLISALGGASIAGRLFYSFLGHHKRIDVRIVFAVTFFFSSVFTLMSPLFTSFTALIIFGPAYAFCVSPHTGYMSDQVISVVGIKRLVSGIGFLLLFAGIGNIMGPPIGGKKNSFWKIIVFSSVQFYELLTSSS